jgi:hypothetical protein
VNPGQNIVNTPKLLLLTISIVEKIYYKNILDYTTKIYREVAKKAEEEVLWAAIAQHSYVQLRESELQQLQELQYTFHSQFQ